MIMGLIAAAASWMRGKKYVHRDETTFELAEQVALSDEVVPA
jgi:hypothetical protein